MDSDVVFGNTRIKAGSDHRRPWALRVDGVAFDTRMDWIAKNSSIKETIEACEAVIFQSEWGRDMVLEYCAEPPGISRIIPNAAETPDGWSKRPKKQRRNIVACARWGDRKPRLFKRLEETIEGFVASGLADKGYTLKILGQTYLDDDRHALPGVEFLGRVPSSTVWEILAGAAALVHLSWFACCPNSVVEALAAHVPVVYCAEGVAELVGDCGIRVRDCEPPHPCNIGKPYPIDVDEVGEAIREAVKKRYAAKIFPDVSIATCAARYVDVLNEAVSLGVLPRGERHEKD
jgi:glycosyltransferase involved in cell wall biosynthesis